MLAGSVPVFTLVACKDKATAEATGGKGARGMRGDGGGLVYAVDLLKVEAKKVSYIVEAPGTIDAFEHVQVTARVSGAVDKVAFSEGQEVKKGDILVTIDAERYQLAVNSSKAAMTKAQASQSDVESQVTRREGAKRDAPRPHSGRGARHLPYEDPHREGGHRRRERGAQGLRAEPPRLRRSLPDRRHHPDAHGRDGTVRPGRRNHGDAS